MTLVFITLKASGKIKERKNSYYSWLFIYTEPYTIYVWELKLI